MKKRGGGNKNRGSFESLLFINNNFFAAPLFLLKAKKKFDNKFGKAYIKNKLLSKQTNPICPLIGCIGGSNSGL